MTKHPTIDDLRLPGSTVVRADTSGTEEPTLTIIALLDQRALEAIRAIVREELAKESLS